MWRYIAGGGSALLLGAAGYFLWADTGRNGDSALPAPPPATGAAEPARSGRPAPPPSADERTKEQRRFDRADRDNDGRVTLEEQTYGRRRAFARLDTDHDGRLSFDEWAARTLRKFAEADADHDRALTRPEFAATAPPRRRPPPRQPQCDCTNRAADDD